MVTEEKPAVDAENKQPAPPPSMYLAKIELQRFRSCLATSVSLRPDLTILVGENNSGKSSVIDAIRLVTTPLSGRRTRYFEHGDISRGYGNSIKIRSEFDGLSDAQKGRFVGAIHMGTGVCSYETTFTETAASAPRTRPVVTAGPGNGPDSESALRDQLCHVYLAPLRDAQREMDSPDGARLANIIELLHHEDDRDKFLDEANSSLGKLNDHDLLKKTATEVQGHIGSLTDAVRGQKVGVQFTDYTLRKLARGLRLKMADAGLDLANLADSGLGYANLVFVATVLLELQNAQETELTILLVEEPEAHLHPQLQAVLLEYLFEQAQASQRHDGTRPAGRIQVVVTTHSPNLASSVPVDNVVVLKTSLGPEGEPLGTKAIAVSDLRLPPSDARKITQYLDATKAALLFARRVILVEGIAEAVLLPVVARKSVLKKLGKAERLFAGVTVIAVGGVDFKPYIRLLLLQPASGASILDKLVIITDRDPDPGAEEGARETRKDSLEAFAATFSAERRLCVFDSEHTLEADLLGVPANRQLLRDAYLDQHPRSGAKWDALLDAASPAAALHAKLAEKKDFIGKGEFAHNVAARIQGGDQFEAPGYLVDAIKCALDLEEGP